MFTAAVYIQRASCEVLHLALVQLVIFEGISYSTPKLVRKAETTHYMADFMHASVSTGIQLQGAKETPASRKQLES